MINACRGQGDDVLEVRQGDSIRILEIESNYLADFRSN